MAKLPSPVDFTADPTLEAVDAALVAAQEREPRPYYGVSWAGQPCARRRWLTYRWAGREEMSAKSLRAIEDGHRGEALMAERLRMVPGITLHTRDPEGKQFQVVALDGHMKGHLDGAILGLLQAPKTWHCWEHKQVNEKKFAAFGKAKAEKGEKAALEHWDGVFFVQAQLYMHLTGMTRHYLTVGTPGVREVASCRTEYDKERALRFLKDSEQVVFQAEPPPRISNDPAWYECRFCPFHAQCHGEAVPAATCRSCAHSTPVGDGQWHCERHGDVIPLDFQREGCDEHRVIPVLVERVAELVSVDGDAVVWKNLLTGLPFDQPTYSSKDMATARDFRVIGDATMSSFKEVFGNDSRVLPGEPPKEIGDAPASDLKPFYGEAA